MIGSSKVRPNTSITVSDIFSDYHDPHKDVLFKRVTLVLQQFQKRLETEMDAANLANLQKMLQKQQTIKSLQNKLSEHADKIEQKDSQLMFWKGKSQQLQRQLSRQAQVLKMSEQKFKELSRSLKHLEQTISDKQFRQNALQQRNNQLIADRQRLQEDNIKYSSLIYSLRLDFGRKIQTSEGSTRIREKQVASEYQQQIQHLKASQVLLHHHKQIEQIKLKRKFIDQSVQCSLGKGSHSPGPRNHRNTARPSPRKARKQETAVQTEATQATQLSNLLEKAEPPTKEQELNLDQIRLIYSKEPVDSKSNYSSARLTKQLKTEKEQIGVQTDKLPQSDKATHAILIDSDSFRQKAEQQVRLAEEWQAKEKKYATRVRELELKVAHRQQEHSNGYLLQAKIGQLELQICKLNQELAKERELLARANHKLQASENQLILFKLTGQFKPRPSKPSSKTCSIFHPRQKTEVFNSRNVPLRAPQEKAGTSHQDLQFVSPRKWEEEEADLITVIKQANNLKSFKVRQRSVTEQNSPVLTPQAGSLIIKRNYKKYSQFKKKFG